MTVKELAVEMRQCFARTDERLKGIEAELVALRKAVLHDTAGQRNLDDVRRLAGVETPAVSFGNVGDEIAISFASVPQSSSRARNNCIGPPSPDRTRFGKRATSSATATCTVRAASWLALPALANPSHPRRVVRRSFQLARAFGPDDGDGKCSARWGAASSTPSRRRAMSRMFVSVELASRTPAPSIALRRAMGTTIVVFPIWLAILQHVITRFSRSMR